MRGVSAIIAIILILMIVVALAVIAYMFSSGIFTLTTSSTEQSINRSTQNLLANMKIEGARENEIFIRNVGQSDLTDFEIYIEDVRMEYDVDKSPLPPGEIATIKIKQTYYEDPPGSGNWYSMIPSGDIKITTGSGLTSTYKQYNYVGSMDNNNAPVVVSEQSFIDFTEPVKGFIVTATAYDADGLNDIYICTINYRRENEIVNPYTYNKESINWPTEVIYNPLDGTCTFNITSLDMSPVYWSNYGGYNLYHHSLTLDNNYIYTVDQYLRIRKYDKATGSTGGYVDVGGGTYGRGMSNDAEFLYFGDSNFNLTKVRKSDLQRNLTIKYGLVTQNYPIYSTAVDDTGVYWGNSLFNVSKVNKTNFSQIFWSIDYSGAANSYITDMDVDDSYIYFTNAINSSVIKLDKNTGTLIWIKNYTATGAGWSLAADGNNLWVGDANLILWQIDKVTGDQIDSTDYGAGTIYEISYDNDFLYFSDSTQSIRKVNKTSKEMEILFSPGGTLYAFGCDIEHCFCNHYGTSSYIYSFFKDPNAGSYSTSESILSYGMSFCDYYGYAITGDCAFLGDAAHTMP